MKKNVKTRDYEYDTPYECCIRSGGNDIVTKGYGVMNSSVYAGDDTSIVWSVVKRITAIICGIIAIIFALSVLAGLWLVAESIHVYNWGGEIQIFNYPISTDMADWLSLLCCFGGGMVSTVFCLLTDKLWD